MYRCMRRDIESLRPVGEFGVLSLIVVGGSIAVTRAGETIPQPGDDILLGLGIAIMATAGIVWLSHTGPGVDMDRRGLLGGLGGIGAIVLMMMLDGSQYTAIGLAVGAGVCVGIGNLTDVL